MSTSLHKRLNLCHKLLKLTITDTNNYDYYNNILDEQLDKLVYENIVKKFWRYFALPQSPSKSKQNVSKPSYMLLIQATAFLNDVYDEVTTHIEAHGSSSIRSQFDTKLHTQIVSNIPDDLHTFIFSTYSAAFKAFLVLQQKNSDSNDNGCDDDMILEDEQVNEASDAYLLNDNIDSSCPGCNQTEGECQCQSIHDQFWIMNGQLKKLDLLQTLVGDVVISVVRGFTERRISAKCKSNFSVSFIDELQSWVEDTVKKWIIDVYGLSCKEDIQSIGEKLDKFLNETYADIRVSHLFDIILDYPDSEAAIQDLKRCLDQTSSQKFRIDLIETVKQSLEKSLLHPGVNTLDILTAYISAIKALRALDPSGLILQLVTEPIRKYLKSRDDTVRCIVTTLTDENHSELNKEMMQTGTEGDENAPDFKSSQIACTGDDAQITQTNWANWKPDPIDLSSIDEQIKSNRFSDIVSILVNIYETKDRFVEEYQKLLSQRLLYKYEESSKMHETELRNLELLTARFSDCELHRCEVMLKDIQASKRIRKRILDDEIEAHKLKNFRDIDVLIVSCPFWPEKFGQLATIGDDPAKIEFPSEIEEAIQNYTKAFETIKANRTLHWRHHLGLVDLDLIFGEGSNQKVLNFKVSPLHAAIIYLFQEKKIWKLNELMVQTSLSAATLRSRLSLWIRNGIIKDSKNEHFELIED